MLSFHFISLFPDELAQFLLKGLIKRAHDQGAFSIHTYQLRDFSTGRHHKVDHYPFSEKKGMIIRADVLYNAITSINGYQNMTIIYACPKGEKLTQAISRTLFSQHTSFICIAGYYEGVDSRIFDLLPIRRISIGDYILNSGDCALVAIAESIIRQADGVLGNAGCIDDESYFNSRLEAEHYTKPVNFHGHEVPTVLRSGDHNAISCFKMKSSLKQTLLNRTDLLGQSPVTPVEKKLLTEIIKEIAEKES